MKKLISKKLLDTLEPTTTPIEIWDTKTPGLLIRVQPSGVASYIAQLGRGRRVTLGRHPAITLELARTRCLAALNEASGGASTAEVRAIVRPKKDDTLTLGGFVDNHYAAWLLENLKTGKAEAARIRSAFADLINRPLPDLTAWVVERWRTDRLKAGRAPSAVNRDMTTLKAGLRRAVEWGHLKSYPLATVKPAKVDDGAVVRYLSPAEEIALRAALEARERRMRDSRDSGNEWREARGVALLPMRDAGYCDHLMSMVLMSLNTGMRRGELFSLRWRDVDTGRRLLVVHGTSAKSGKTRYVPLSEEGLSVLQRWQPEPLDLNALVFPGRTGERFHTLKTAWGALLKDAKISNFRWHDMRHSFASKLVQSGVDINVLRALLGHADIKMTLRYAHLADSDLQDAMAKMQPAQAQSKAKHA